MTYERIRNLREDKDLYAARYGLVYRPSLRKKRRHQNGGEDRQRLALSAASAVENGKKRAEKGIYKKMKLGLANGRNL